MSTWRRAGVTLKAFHYADWTVLLLWIRRNVLPVHSLLVVGPFWYIIGILFGWNKDINTEQQVNIYSCYISATQSNIDGKIVSVWDKYNSKSKKKSFLSKRNQYWLWIARLSRFRQAGGYKATFSSSAGFVKLRQTITLNIHWVSITLSFIKAHYMPYYPMQYLYVWMLL